MRRRANASLLCRMYWWGAKPKCSVARQRFDLAGVTQRCVSNVINDADAKVVMGMAIKRSRAQSPHKLHAGKTTLAIFEPVLHQIL
jgi:hypothetical protein